MKTSSILKILPSGIVALPLLAASPDAGAATLLYGLDFNEMRADNMGLDFINLGSGATAVTTAAIGYGNYHTSTPIADGGYSHSPFARTFEISNAGGIAGLDLDRGFSVSIDVASLSSSGSWKNAITLDFGSTSDFFQLQRNASNGWMLYTAGSLTPSGGVALGNSANGAWLNINLVFQGNQLSVYNGGTLVRTTTTNLEGKQLTAIRGGGNGRGSNQILIDNLGIYDGVLSSEEFAYIRSNGLSSVPEPTTATLSLLGLACLSLRRKRR